MPAVHLLRLANFDAALRLGKSSSRANSGLARPAGPAPCELADSDAVLSRDVLDPLFLDKPRATGSNDPGLPG